MEEQQKQPGLCSKPLGSSVRIALILFGASLALTFIGMASLPIDVTVHGVIPTFLGIISLYFYQDAIATMSIPKFMNGVAFIALFFFLGSILLIANNCMCEIGVMKTRMVLFTVPVIGLIMIFRMKWPRRTS